MRNDMLGEMITDGKTLWINSENDCIFRISCMDILTIDMKPVKVDIHKAGELLNVTRVE